MSDPEVPIDADLLERVANGENSHWEAMIAQTCRTTDRLAAELIKIERIIGDLQKKISESPKRGEPFKLVPRGGGNWPQP